MLIPDFNRTWWTNVRRCVPQKGSQPRIKINQFSNPESTFAAEDAPFCHFRPFCYFGVCFLGTFCWWSQRETIPFEGCSLPIFRRTLVQITIEQGKHTTRISRDGHPCLWALALLALALNQPIKDRGSKSRTPMMLSQFYFSFCAKTETTMLDSGPCFVNLNWQHNVQTDPPLVAFCKNRWPWSMEPAPSPAPSIFSHQTHQNGHLCHRPNAHSSIFLPGAGPQSSAPQRSRSAPWGPSHR